MARVSSVEARIKKVEGFDVRIRHAEPGRRKGRDVRGDREQVPGYRYRRKRSDDHSVAAWVQGRFQPHYTGFEVDVLDGSGSVVGGNTKLRTVRNSYDDRS